MYGRRETARTADLLGKHDPRDDDERMPQVFRPECADYTNRRLGGFRRFAGYGGVLHLIQQAVDHVVGRIHYA